MFLIEHRHQPGEAQTVIAPATSSQPETSLKTTAAKTPAAPLVQPGASVSDEELMASIDKDVSRIAPSAMEPLAQLMDEGEIH